jgi:hypothetical protein
VGRVIELDAKDVALGKALLVRVVGECAVLAVDRLVGNEGGSNEGLKTLITLLDVTIVLAEHGSVGKGSQVFLTCSGLYRHLFPRG